MFRAAEKYGYLTTVLGRRRYFPHISSSQPSLRSQAQRQAFKSVHHPLSQRVTIFIPASSSRALLLTWPRLPCSSLRRGWSRPGWRASW